MRQSYKKKVFKNKKKLEVASVALPVCNAHEENEQRVSAHLRIYSFLFKLA